MLAHCWPRLFYEPIISLMQEQINIWAHKRLMTTRSLGRGRPPLPPDQKGVQIRHRVLPATREALIEISAQTGEAAGAILDRLVAREHRKFQVAHLRSAK